MKTQAEATATTGPQTTLNRPRHRKTRKEQKKAKGEKRINSAILKRGNKVSPQQRWLSCSPRGRTTAAETYFLQLTPRQKQEIRSKKEKENTVMVIILPPTKAAGHNFRVPASHRRVWPACFVWGGITEPTFHASGGEERLSSSRMYL